ncbi:hypothetical protein NCS57_00252400 [Fusarium keratoplasticum]|uniref:Uncharacterized protein n=1 Tax=Fusarium keratoplasticum TaxID=1328300 RepID=A0ACC0RAS9_9HYPO|nr:hypothetical protein NCS57_00252400 [Fusarium keratoplasticum]KAI8679738.1 hypothetical protein NCS57_00252400 [Fusarium keratoplasticum]KAI8685824.1 hypothetical protein NCS55_00256000 [Fusarium keratoplasticum]
MTPARGRTKARFWVGDEEMAKKDDDHHIHGHNPRLPQWQATRAPRRRALGRLVAYVVFASLIFYAVYNLILSPSDSVTDRRQSATDREAAPGHGANRGGQDKAYNGPLRFPELAKTLRNIQGTGGSYERNRNVLFAASNLKSVSTLLPMACQMSAEGQNHVHFAIAGRSEVPLEVLLQINGIDGRCKLFPHDARTDHAATSTETRLKLATIRSFFYINNFMHPQAIIVDGSHLEDDYFLRSIRDQVMATKSALIELPDKPETRFSWISKLDASSLSAWNKVHFDIIIQAPPLGTANLQRLLTSLRNADKSPITIPHLTIELPSVVEQPLEKFLSDFQWPLRSSGQLPQSQMISLRHRIPSHQIDEEESSVRFLESFWPGKPSHNHVLVLAPHTEVSSQFFHYVKFTMLHSFYSRASILHDWTDNIMGISLQSRSTLLDDTTPLTAPKTTDEEPDNPFFWQAPTSDAILIMGDKWVELHGYVSRILERQQTKKDTPAFLAKKHATKKHPAWLEYVLQLSRLRGYLTLYPSPETASVILGAHSDLSNVPEEYLGDEEEDGDKGRADKATSTFDSTSQIDMLVTLPGKGELPALEDIPLVSWDGKTLTFAELESSSRNLARLFRQEVGGCSESESDEEDDYGMPRRDKDAGDLFCNTAGSASEAAPGSAEAPKAAAAAPPADAAPAEKQVKDEA